VGCHAQRRCSYGGVLSPCLSNIYLDRLDTFVETTLLPGYNRGVLRKHNPEYQRVQYALAKARVRGDHAAVRVLQQQQRGLPSHDPQDHGYRRLRYVRYADDILLGFTGPKAEAEEIKHRLAQFLRDDLKLELSETKTLITHARTSAARFLGYEIIVAHDNRRQTTGRRSVNGLVQLRVPVDVIKAKCSRYTQGGKPASRTELMNEEDYAIISRYGAEYRGIVQYYLLAGDVYRLNRLHWVMGTSLLKTLAGKYSSTVSKMACRYKATIETPHGPRKCLRVSVNRGTKRKPLVATFGGIPLQRQKLAVLQDREPTRATAPQRADPSALEGTVRALRASGRGASPPDPKARRSRTAPAAGTTRVGKDHGQTAAQDPRGLRTLPRRHPPPEANRVNHGIVAGEPGDRKRSRRVREGGVGKGPARAPRRRRTSTRRAPAKGQALRRRQDGQPAHVIEIAWQAQRRLHRVWQRLAEDRGKRRTIVAVAVARELTGFCWALANAD